MALIKRPGMSVIEVLVALGMASILIFSVGNLVSATHRLNSASAAQQQATLTAQALIEQLISFADNPVNASKVFDVNNNGVQKYDPTLTPLNPAVTAWITISSAGDKNIQNVTSIAEWTSGTLSHQEKISTVITNWKNFP